MLSGLFVAGQDQKLPFSVRIMSALEGVVRFAVRSQPQCLPVTVYCRPRGYSHCYSQQGSVYPQAHASTPILSLHFSKLSANRPPIKTTWQPRIVNRVRIKLGKDQLFLLLRYPNIAYH